MGLVAGLVLVLVLFLARFLAGGGRFVNARDSDTPLVGDIGRPLVLAATPAAAIGCGARELRVHVASTPDREATGHPRLLIDSRALLGHFFFSFLGDYFT